MTPNKKSTTKNKHYCFLCLDGESHVVEAQVVDHLKMVREKEEGIAFDLFLLGRMTKGSIPSLFQRSRKREIEEKIGGRLHTRLCPNIVNLFFNAIVLLFQYTFPACFTRRLIIHARANFGGFAAFAFKWLCLGYPRIIYDERGYAIAEYHESLKASGHNPHGIVGKLGTALIYCLEGLTLRSASHIIYVSSAFRQLMEKKFPFTKRKKTSVFPCLSDSRKFYYDPELRAKMRRSFGLTEGQLVLAYVGGMQSYQCFKDMVKLVGLLRKRDRRIRLLFATSEHKHTIIKKVFRDHLPADCYLILATPHDQVCGLLNAADMGLLLREKSLVNEVASPTKFAEYMLCGLPCILTEGIGDYSRLAREHDIGTVINDLNKLHQYTYQILKFFKTKNDDMTRQGIAQIALGLFAREVRIKDYITIYNSL